jgi:TolB-like protein
MKKFNSCAIVFLVIAASWNFVHAQAKTTIAVLSFEAKNVGQATAEAVSDIISTELFNTKRFRVIERQAINKVISELQFQMTGVTDMSQAVEIGKMLNAEKVVVGTVSRFGERTIIINIKLVDVKTGNLELAEKDQTDNGEEGLPDAAVALVQKIAQKIVVEGSIIKISPTIILIDMGKVHGVREGQVLDVIRIGDVVTDLAGTVIGRTEDRIGALQIITVRDEFSEAKAVETKQNFRLGDKVRISTTPIEMRQEEEEPSNPKPTRYKKVNDKKNEAEPPPAF